MKSILKQLEKTKKALKPSELEEFIQYSMDNVQSIIDCGVECTFEQLVNKEGIIHCLTGIETVATVLRENIFNVSVLIDNSSIDCDECDNYTLCMTANGTTYRLPLEEDDVEDFSDNFTIMLIAITRAVGLITKQINRAVNLVKESCTIKMVTKGEDSDERAYNTLLTMINNRDTDDFTKHFVSQLVEQWETSQTDFLTLSKKVIVHTSPFYHLLSNGLKVDKIDDRLPIRMLELLVKIKDDIPADDLSNLITKISQIGILIENPVLKGKMHEIDKLSFDYDYTSLFRSIYEEESLGVNALNREEKEMLKRIIILDNIVPKIRETIISLGGVAEEFDNLDDELCDCNLCQEDREEINEIISRLANHENKNNVPKEVTDAVSVLASFFN